MPSSIDPSTRAETPLLIAFADLTRYQVQTRRVGDAALAEVMNAFYEKVTAPVVAAGGRVVKFIGDAALLVFPEDRVDAGVAALLALKEEVDAWFAGLRWEPRLVVKAHFGAAISGPFGPPGDARYDVLGHEVNTAATLEGGSFTLSAQAFRKLGPELRQRFKKHTPAVTYIRVEDPHRG
jgi:class 3 adenylate cyclase